MEQLWDLVKKFFELHQLRFAWRTECHPADPDVLILITAIKDVENNESTETKRPIRLAPGDFRLNGAALSYYRRMDAIALAGLIDNSDEDAEVYGTTPVVETRTETGEVKSKSTRTKPQMDDLPY